ncbi:GNAT family N-acetyltransferase [Paenibacillus rhizosphaerae]|uniref:GNAT family N-acetyltransferase n=1 Tax=Paenibacillus rhizosphaerae TaxID=297318 RepID=UPI0035E441E4
MLKSAPFAETGGLAVDAVHRRMGVGQKLVRQCIGRAQCKSYGQLRVCPNGESRSGF